MKIIFTSLLLLAMSTLAIAQSFSVSLPDSLSQQSLDGRLLVLLSKKHTGEPRFQISDGPGSQQIFGIDVDNWKPGTSKTIDASAFGYPIEKLNAY